jgi:hypothetical protein
MRSVAEVPAEMRVSQAIEVVPLAAKVAEVVTAREGAAGMLRSMAISHSPWAAKVVTRRDSANQIRSRIFDAS